MSTPYFSICIPQFNRTAHLLLALEALRAQSFQAFEICISDDASTDGREPELCAWLETSGLSFRYVRQQESLRYDGNLRASIALASGDYCVLMGNDDALAHSDTLAEIQEILEHQRRPEVLVANYQQWQDGEVHRRILRSGPRGSGALLAASSFRLFSFVSGLVIARKPLQALAHARWDGSEMYQTWSICRMLAQGARMYGDTRITVLKDIQIPGQSIDRYDRRPRERRWPIKPQKLPMGELASLVTDAIDVPGLGREQLTALGYSVLRQLYAFTYPFWIFEYRRVQHFSYSLGVGLALAPSRISPRLPFSRVQRVRLWSRYVVRLSLALCLPIQLFERMRPLLHRLAKRQFGG